MTDHQDGADIGLVGLGTMGANLALNMADNGFRVAVYNRTRERTVSFLDQAGRLREKLVDCASPEAFAAAIRPPRPVVMMVQAGDAVDETMSSLAKYLSDGDAFIDAGNSNYFDSQRRSKETSDRDLKFLGLGVSGGEEGARYGPAMMAGGDKDVFDRVSDILMAIAADFQGEPCCAYLGTDGAGHFVKTIHNGIEYADMQMIAEVYGIMRDGLGLQPIEMAEIFSRWNDGPLRSYLIEITAKVLEATDPETDQPMVDIIRDTAGQKGTGRWSAIEAQKLGVPATTIAAAVSARAISSRRETRQIMARRYGFRPKPMGDALGSTAMAVDTLENALLAGKIAAYAQGFSILSEASDHWSWNLPLMTVARIWRAGCIIRSRFLDTIATGFEESEEGTSLLAMPQFVDMIGKSEAKLRRTVALAAMHGSAAPALSASLAYLDGIRSETSTANLIQAQRDFFGAHGFERTDREGKDFHGPWAMGFKA